MKAGDALLGIGGTLVSISLPLLCFGDAAKREANVDYETFNLHFKSKIINPGPTSVKYNTMKKFLILFVTMITSIVALAQDLIVTTDSKKIEAKIIEISSDQVKYKEYDMPDGPTFVLSTKEISMIIFSSGKVILYEREAPKNTIVQQRSGNDFLYRTGNTYVYNGKQMRGKEYANFLKQYDIDGINVDFENIYEADKDKYSRFIIELMPRMLEMGIVTSVDVTAPDGADNWSMCFDRNVIGNVADYIIFMAYDQYGVSSTTAGTTAGCDWVETNVKKFLGQEEVSADKLILGIPFYTRIWKEVNGNVTSDVINIGNIDKVIPSNAQRNWDESLNQYYVEYKKNGVTYKVWIEDEKSIEAKLNLISKYNLGGAAYWEYDRSTESVWKLISEKIGIK